jgi:hypothetical protein
MGTAFTYQGQLKLDDQVLDGAADFQFSLWDAATDGTQIGLTQPISNHTVVDGLFSVALDFGSHVFTGDARWLQIAVRTPPGSGGFTVLSPRQPLTAIPYSLYALSGPGSGSCLWQQSGADIYYVGGNVGIGTGSPSSNLHVRETGSGDPSPPARIGLQWFQPMDLNDWFSIEVGGLGIGTGSSPRLVRESGTALYFQTETQMNSVQRNTQMILDADGKLGLGTTTPISMLELVSDSGVHGIRSTTSAIPMSAFRTSPTGSWPAIHAESASMSSGATAVRAYITSTSPGSGSAAVYGQNSGTTMNGYGVHGSHSGFGTGVYGVSANGTGVYGESTGGGFGVYAKSTNGDALYAEAAGTGLAARFIGNVEIISQSTGLVLIEFGEGLDYAEGFDVASESDVVPGTVLVIDPDNPGELAISRTPYDRKVAGVVAGANGLGSAVRLGAGQYDTDVALAGRVYCNVDASFGAVHPGDLLTTSSTPGYAMKVADHEKAQGAVLGKAMQPLKQGERGQILVLVTLQ